MPNYLPCRAAAGHSNVMLFVQRLLMQKRMNASSVDGADFSSCQHRCKMKKISLHSGFLDDLPELSDGNHLHK
jgi:hypothetical protein